MMFYRRNYNLVNGFNENYFLYFEDTQFCTDIISNNLKVYYLGDVVINHYGGGSSKQLRLLLRKFHFLKSAIVFFIININKY